MIIDEVKTKALEDKVPIIKDDGLLFVLKTVEVTGAKDILELGTAVGYSSMHMASLDKDIHIDTIERNEDMYKQAVVNIKDNGFDNQIDVHFMPIEEFKTLKTYDLIFVDAAKAQYGKYTEKFYNNLKKGGVFIYDNMIFHGLIYKIDEINSRSLRSMLKKIVNFRDFMVNDERFDIIMHDEIGDGILIAIKK